MAQLIRSALLFAGAVSCQKYIFSFGDSYTTVSFNANSDKPSASNPIGNPPYPGVTTCNGANYVDIFATSQTGTLAYDFAVGGAAVNNSITTSTVPDFRAQRQLFSDNLVPAPSYAAWTSSNSIFTVFFGINDIAASYVQGNTPLSLNTQIFQTYTTELEALYDAGARLFLLLTVPPFTEAPIYQSFPANVEGILVSNDIIAWNNQLGSVADSFKAAHPDTTVHIYQTNAIWENILDNPTEYGAPDKTCTNMDGTSCLFWDGLHPGQAIQQAWGADIAATAQSLGF